MSQTRGYLRRLKRTKKKQKKPSVRSIRQSELDGKHRLWTLMSARYLGVIGDEDRNADKEYIVADYPVLTVCSVHDTLEQATKAMNKPYKEGEWK